MSISTPIYSAVGRIRKCLILEPNTDNYPVHIDQAGEPEYAVVKELADAYRGFTRLLTEKGVNLVVVFIPANKIELNLDRDFSFSNDGITFLAPKDNFIFSHPYAQDLIHFIPISKGVYATRFFNVSDDGILDTVVFRSLQKADLIPQKLLTATNKIAAGGNILRGRNNREDYLLIGQEEHCKLNLKELSDFFNIKKHRIFQCPISHENHEVAKTLYHLDLYIAIAGRLIWKDQSTGKFESGEVIFYADFSGVGSSDFNIARDRSVSNLVKQSGEFRIDYLPAILINGQLYSYCNCLVENYPLLNGQKNVCFYFPDYTDEFDKQEAQLKNDLDGTLLQNTYASLSILNYQYKENKGDLLAMAASEEPADYFLPIAPITSLRQAAENVQQKIKDHLHDCYGVSKENIHFIKNKFTTLASDKAGLHCLVKVIERDRVNLD